MSSAVQTPYANRGWHGQPHAHRSSYQEAERLAAAFGVPEKNQLLVSDLFDAICAKRQWCPEEDSRNAINELILLVLQLRWR